MSGSSLQTDAAALAMRILVLSGIFPPDIGGPATHAADVRAELGSRGHEVIVLTLSDQRRAQEADGVLRFPRGWPWPVRTAAAFAWIIRKRSCFDVVYATGLGPIAVAGGRCSRRPVVLKIVGDPAWERSVRRGLTDDDFDRFQTSGDGGLAVQSMRRLRNWTTRAATKVVTPSSHLAELVKIWAKRDDVVVIPNGVRLQPSSVLRRRNGDRLRLVFVGRLVDHKNVDILIEAVASTSQARLEVIGDGPELERLTALVEKLDVGDRVAFTGAVPHDRVMQRVAASDALVLASGYEGLPHVVLEALASGVPVITVGTHGLGDLVTDGTDGVLVPAATPQAYSEAFERLCEEPGLIERLQAGAVRTGRQWSLAHAVDRLEALLGEVADQPISKVAIRS